MSDFTPITISVQHTGDDYTKAQQLFYQTPKTLNARWVRYVVLAFVLGLGAVYIYVQQRLIPPHHVTHHTSNTLWNVLSMLVMIALFAGFWTFIMRQARGKVNGEEAIQQMTFSEDGVHLQTDTFQTHFQWRHWKKALEDQHLLMLVRDLQLLVIPKRAVADADLLLRLRTLIEQQVGGINAGLAVKTTPPPPPAKTV
jgi:hypothetical protein